MLNRIRFYLIIFATFVLTCCSGDGSSNDPLNDKFQKPASDPAYGQINGHPWAFKSGSAHVIRKNFDYYLVVRLWGEVVADPCNEKQGSALQVRLTAPMQVSDWRISPDDPFNSTFTLFFSDKDFKPQPLDNMKADEGSITFFGIDKSQVMGEMMGTFKNPKVGRTMVQGSFAVPVCSNFISDGDNLSL